MLLRGKSPDSGPLYPGSMTLEVTELVLYKEKVEFTAEQRDQQ